MRADDLTLERWDRLSTGEKERTARALSLPAPLTLEGLERCAMPDDERLVAVFVHEWELCDEPGVLRGGDGGSMICGGAGFFAGWLPLASAYRDPTCAEWREQPIPDTRVRRVLVLDL